MKGMMAMRICFLAGLVSVAAIGWGAEPTMVQRIVNSGLAELRQYPAVSFQLFGKETLGPLRQGDSRAKRARVRRRLLLESTRDRSRAASPRDHERLRWR